MFSFHNDGNFYTYAITSLVSDFEQYLGIYILQLQSPVCLPAGGDIAVMLIWPLRKSSGPSC